MQIDKINELNTISTLFRFITPIFQVILSIASAIILMYLTGLKTDIKTLSLQFTNHLSDHKQIEIIYEKRLVILETLLQKIR